MTFQHIKRPTGYRTKQATVLHYLTFDGSLNCFEAEVIGDHCLHSTISTLRNDYGLDIQDVFETVPTRANVPTPVKRYWLARESRPAALELLSGWRIKQGGRK